MRTEGSGELHPHVSQSTETDDTDLLTLGDALTAHRGVGGDPGAEKWRDPGQKEKGAMRIVPLKYSAGPFPEGCEPLCLMFIFCISSSLWSFNGRLIVQFFPDTEPLVP